MGYQMIDDLKEIDLSNRHVYIWGTGNTSVLYQEGFAREPWLDIYGYGVNDDKQYGKTFYGKRIYSPKEISEDKKAIVLINSQQPVFYKQINKQMNELGIEHYTVDKVILGKNKEKLNEVLSLLEDEYSIATYLHILECRIKCVHPKYDYFDRYPYTAISEFARVYQDDVFIDCGAFVGDTVERYIWEHFGTFKKIIAIEPDSNNYMAMANRIKRLTVEWALSEDKIQLHKMGLSSQSYVASMGKGNAEGLGSFIDDKNNGADDVSVKIVSVDDLMGDEKYTFLKADIESWEYKMLLGAEKSIKKWKPRLGISIYHNITDLYSIPLLIKNINPDYKLAIRHHSAQLADTILYAWE